MGAGKKIMDGLRDAIDGNFSRVTIGGQAWERIDGQKSAAYDAMLAALRELATGSYSLEEMKALAAAAYAEAMGAP